MSGLRSARKAPGAKASGNTGGVSTHRTVARPLANAGAKASGDAGGVSTHKQLSPDRRAKAGAKASRPGRNSIVAPDSGFYHGTERVTEHHRK